MDSFVDNAWHHDGEVKAAVVLDDVIFNVRARQRISVRDDVILLLHGRAPLLVASRCYNLLKPFRMAGITNPNETTAFFVIVL